MINKLEYFLTVAKYENITRAAEELYITQPALSTAIARLEKDLGVVLFERQGHSIVLTETGRHIIPYIENVCSNYTSLLNELESYQHNSANSLRLGAGMRHVVSIVDNYIFRHPDAGMLMSQYYNYYELKKSLLNQEIDLCLCAPPITGMGITSRDVCTEPLCAVFSDHHPFHSRVSVSLEEIAEETVLGLPSNFPMRVVADNVFKEAGITPHYIIEAENNALMNLLHMHSSKNYVTIYPLSRCKELHNLFEDICYTPINDKGCTRTIAISWLDSRPPSPQVQQLISFIEEFYKTSAFSSAIFGRYASEPVTVPYDTSN